MNKYPVHIIKIEFETQNVIENIATANLFEVYQARARDEGGRLYWLDEDKNTYLIIFAEKKYILILHKEKELELSPEEYDSKQIERLKEMKRGLKENEFPF